MRQVRDAPSIGTDGELPAGRAPITTAARDAASRDAGDRHAGARVLAEIGDDRSRFQDAKGLKAYAGAAPITRNLFGRMLGCLRHCPATGQYYDEATAFPATTARLPHAA
jgi:Transposase IS116/IS110/IS902 family